MTSLTILAAASPAVGAGDVALRVSSREVYVGESVVVQIQVVNAEQHDPPVFPDIPAARVRGGSSGTSRNVSWVNGRMTQQVTVTYSYTVTPTRPGTLEIPSIPVRVDGRVLETAPARIVVTAVGQELGQLVLLELASDRDSLYLGETIDVTLEIWIRPYRDRNVRLDAEDTLLRIDFEGSEWGSFRDTIVQLQNRQQRWRYREDVRTDAQGAERAYYVYLVPMTFAPTTSGPLNVGDVQVVVQYPTRSGPGVDVFGRPKRDFFSGQVIYEVTQSRPVVAGLEESSILVRSPPDEGQPPWFNGAVGQYRFEVTAAHTRVRVREPIELTMTIAGRGVLERLAPPPLAQIEELTRDFRVPGEALSGVVEGGRKRFEVTISAKNADVTEIPAIPFAYFDPAAERYVTVWSDPLPVEVEAAEQVAIGRFAPSDENGRSRTGQLTQTTVGIRANYVEVDNLLARQAFSPGWPSLAVLVVSPLAFAVCFGVRRHRDRLLHDQGYARRRRAWRTALAALNAARSGSGQGAAEVGAVVVRYISDRCNAPSGLTAAEAVGALRDRGAGAERIQAVDALLQKCEALQYAGGRAEGAADLAEQARRCIHQLERERL